MHREPIWKSRLLIAQALTGLAGLVAIAYISTYAYRLGRSNAGGIGDVPVAILPGLAILLLLAFIHLIIASYASTRPEDRRRSFAILGLFALSSLVVYAAVPHGYQPGFERWVSTNVAEKPIAAWATTLPAVDKETPIDVEMLPSPVRVLEPAAAVQHPDGIVIQWGILATWGTSRKVFVGHSATSMPPDDPHHQWVQIRPRLWYGIQTPG